MNLQDCNSHLGFDWVVAKENYEEWKAERQFSAGASDPLDETSARRKAGLEEPFNGNIHTEAGSALEGAIRLWWSEKVGYHTQEAEWLLRRPEVPWMHATPDGWIVSRQRGAAVAVTDRIKGIVEVKCVGLPAAHEWVQMPLIPRQKKDRDTVRKYQQAVLEAPLNSGPPKKYVDQVQQQLFVTGLNYGYLVGLIGGKRLVWYNIERDEDRIQKRIEACKRFMDKVYKLRADEHSRLSKEIQPEHGESE